MEPPHIPHRIRDTEHNIEYVVMAYRPLTHGEVVQQIRAHLSSRRRRPRKGSKVTILTVLGATDRL